MTAVETSLSSPGCEKTFITFSALFSHNRTHFRETGQFICNYPGCDKRYDKACRLKIHLRSHTGTRRCLVKPSRCRIGGSSMAFWVCLKSLTNMVGTEFRQKSTT